VDRSRCILYWNRSAERITGYLAHEVAGQYCQGGLLMHCDLAGAPMCGQGCPLSAVLVDGNRRECTAFLAHKDGHRVPVNIRSQAICDSSGAVIGAMEVFEEAQAYSRLDRSALQACGCLDKLTQVATRPYAEMKLAQALEAFQRFGIPFGWLRIALDGLDDHQQRFGHGMVDAAAKMIALTLDCGVGPFHLLSCWGRAEFRLQVQSGGQQSLAELSQQLVQLVRVSKLEWWGDTRHVTVSIAGGMALPGDTVESLEARVAEVFENCQAGGGDRAAVSHGDWLPRLHFQGIK
jgi:PAS domain S-box-containing protein